ncbi:MAG: IS110 family transposase [Hyphomonadaceae bacterium]|nr:IS110 family transposase [Hyphomonadaceae bacterium]
MAKLYAGLDVSQDMTAICVVDARGKVVLETSVATDAKSIGVVLRPFRRSIEQVGHEVGPLSPLLHEALLKQRFPMVCLDARKARAAMAAQRNKTDRNDAQAIAILLARGFGGDVHVKSIEAQRAQTLLLFRNTLARKIHDLDRVLGGKFKQFGAKMKRAADGTPIIIWPARGKDADVSAYATHLLHARASAASERDALERLIQAEAKADPICRRFMTVPGVGPLTALTFRAAVDEPHRFRSSRNLGAYFGLTPRRFQSGKTDLHGRMSKAGNVEVRAALFQAAHCLLVCTKRESRLRTWGLRLAQRRSLTHARIACSRKLAVILHRMWITETDFAPN